MVVFIMIKEVFMSTKEMAYKIIEHLTEEQLQGFINLFGAIIQSEDKKQEERDNAFKQLQHLRKSVNNFDEKKELDEYRKEKFNI